MLTVNGFTCALVPTRTLPNYPNREIEQHNRSMLDTPQRRRAIGWSAWEQVTDGKLPCFQVQITHTAEQVPNCKTFVFVNRVLQNPSKIMRESNLPMPQDKSETEAYLPLTDNDYAEAQRRLAAEVQKISGGGIYPVDKLNNFGAMYLNHLEDIRREAIGLIPTSKLVLPGTLRVWLIDVIVMPPGTCATPSPADIMKNHLAHFTINCIPITVMVSMRIAPHPQNWAHTREVLTNDTYVPFTRKKVPALSQLQLQDPERTPRALIYAPIGLPTHAVFSEPGANGYTRDWHYPC
ncbi:hypothetical protein BDZ97DRAFT_1372644 [Flammula alnicola]|nr:hypothetical protein BDZ97DRAFT_1372644 [Flammula alnicola]